jgi:hypothetical protein
VTHPAANPEFLDVEELPARTRRIYQAVMGGSNLPLRTAGAFRCNWRFWCRGRGSNPHGAFAPEDFKGWALHSISGASKT